MKRLLDVARRFALLFNENRLPMAAAALSYNLTMTFFPLVIVLYTMLGNNYAKAMRVLAFAEQFLASETVTAIRDGGRDKEVTVEFDNYGVKKMFAGFAKLVKV